MKPGLFFDGGWESHVHWRKTPRKPWWQCRLVRSRTDGRFKGSAHISNARGYLQFTLSWGVRYRFVLNAADAAKRSWGALVREWQYLPVVGPLPDSPHGPLAAVGELFSAFLAAEQLCGRWGGADNLEWGLPHAVEPCHDCPPAIIYRLKQRGVPNLVMPRLPKWPQQEWEVVNVKPKASKVKPQLELFRAG